jgi:hypothetical protein
MAYSPKNANGQATMANSEPVVIASDQSAVPVSGTVTANIGTVATLATAAKQDTGNTSLATLAGAVSGTEMQVDVLTMPTVTVNSHAVTNAGTFATQVDGAALTALQLIDDPVFADDAAFTLSTSKGHVMAGVAVDTDGTDPTSVSAEGDASAVRTDRNRRQLSYAPAFSSELTR